ncbi:MAG: type II secretion system protein [Cyanobacteria bacterium SIG31]|nr:type II secretion system protein [Cyanobacteria bacterium SIG31]
MKKGYTLAEVLVALGIVSVIAALTLPLINKYKPDTNKVMYLKAYDSLVEVTQKIVESSNLYNLALEFGNDRTYNLQKYPLLETETNKVIDGTDLGNGPKAFTRVLCSTFNKAASCKDITDTFTIKNGSTITVKPSLDTTSGILSASTSTDSTAQIFYTITLDIDGDEGANIVNNGATDTVPDRFLFMVTANGKVIPTDSYGQAYVASRSNLKKVHITKEDLAKYPLIDETTFISTYKEDIQAKVADLVENNGSDDSAST